MPIPKKPDSKICVEQFSSAQQMIAELVNPEIDKRRKKAIALSPPIREQDLMKCKNIPNCWVQFHKGRDKSKYLEHFESVAGVARLMGSTFADRNRGLRIPKEEAILIAEGGWEEEV